MERFLFPTVIGLLMAANRAVSAETFVFNLNDGGQIVGELLNLKEIPRQAWQIKTAKGAVITLDRAQIKDKPIRQRPAEVEYEKIRPRYPDTAEGQWAIAEWCRERSLLPQRRAHLERIIELSPDDAKARHALGFSKVNGKWTTQDESMKELGYVKYDRQYRPKQEIELIEAKKKSQKEEIKWEQNVGRWRRWLGTGREQEAVENFRAIEDPVAVRAIARGISESENMNVRIMLVAVLGKLATPDAAKNLAYFAIEDGMEEVRLSCLDHLKKMKDPAAVNYFVGRLHGKEYKDQVYMRRAAVALKELGDRSAVGPLIDALWTKLKVVIQPPPSGNMNAGFGSGAGMKGGGFSTGQEPPEIRYPLVFNPDALQALCELTGVNFDDDSRAWRSWYAAQKKREMIDTRRGEGRVISSGAKAAKEN